MLDTDEVHLWRITLDGLPSAALARLDAALAPADRTRRDTLVRPHAAARYTVAHGALRILLGRCLSVPAASVRIRTGELGKPELTGHEGNVRFSLSHARGLALAAVTAGRAVGVDLEYPRADFPLHAFVRRYFPPEERELVDSAPPDERGRTFLRLWTRKEAVVKAAGGRMAVGVAQPVHTPGTHGVVHGRDARLRGTWHVADLAPAPHAVDPHPKSTHPMSTHAVAAVALAGSRPYRVRTHDWSADAARWAVPHPSPCRGL